MNRSWMKGHSDHLALPNARLFLPCIFPLSPLIFITHFSFSLCNNKAAHTAVVCSLCINSQLISGLPRPYCLCVHMGSMKGQSWKWKVRCTSRRGNCTNCKWKWFWTHFISESSPSESSSEDKDISELSDDSGQPGFCKRCGHFWWKQGVLVLSFKDKLTVFHNSTVKDL
jgi:hypothetical protein